MSNSDSWIISASRLVQIQGASSEDVARLLQTRGSEVFVLRSARPRGVKEADIEIKQYHVRHGNQNSKKKSLF